MWSLIGSLTQPIFKGGQLMHQRRAAVAAAQEAAANYQATVITAFQNVSNTLYALQADADALAAQTTAERTAADSLALVQAQYKSGGASYLQVLTRGTEPIKRPRSRWSRRARNASPTRPHCFKHSGAAGGTATGRWQFDTSNRNREKLREETHAHHDFGRYRTGRGDRLRRVPEHHEADRPGIGAHRRRSW